MYLNLSEIFMYWLQILYNISNRPNFVMMKIVPPNMLMLVFRIVLLVLFGFMSQWPIEIIQIGTFPDGKLAFWVGLLFFSIFPVYLIWTFLGVMCVGIGKGRIRFYRIFGIVDVTTTSIKGYYRSPTKTKLASFKGLLVKLNSGKVIEISGYNLSSIEKIETHLNQHGVPLWGELNSWFPYTRKL